MRSRASLSAASALRIAGARGGIDLGRASRAGRSWPRSTRSNFRVSSISARSPPARTSSMMARTACFHVGRRLALDAEEGGKPVGKIGALAVQAKGHGMTLPVRPGDRSMGDGGLGVNPAGSGPCPQRRMARGSARGRSLASAENNRFTSSFSWRAAWPFASPSSWAVGSCTALGRGRRSSAGIARR